MRGNLPDEAEEPQTLTFKLEDRKKNSRHPAPEGPKRNNDPLLVCPPSGFRWLRKQERKENVVVEREGGKGGGGGGGGEMQLPPPAPPTAERRNMEMLEWTSGVSEVQQPPELDWSKGGRAKVRGHPLTSVTYTGLVCVTLRKQAMLDSPRL